MGFTKNPYKTHTKPIQASKNSTFQGTASSDKKRHKKPRIHWYKRDAWQQETTAANKQKQAV